MQVSGFLSASAHPRRVARHKFAADIHHTPFETEYIMDYKVLSNEDATRQRAEAGWGSLTWLASAQLGNAAGLTLGRVVIRTGESNPRHCHRNCEEILYLLSGQLEHSIGADTVTLKSGDSLTIPAGVFHNAASTGEEDADMIVAYSSAQRDFVLESEASAR